MHCNISDEDNGKAISDMLRYFQHSYDENICNSDIRDLNEIVSRVRQSEEVSIKYMKSWEKDSIPVQISTLRPGCA